MNAESGDPEGGAGGVEILIFDLVFRAAVNGVSVLSTEFRNGKIRSATADLLIWSKRNAYFPVGEILLQNPFGSSQNLCNASLIVGSKQRCAVGGDQRAAFQRRKVREHIRRENTSGGKRNGSAVIILINLGLYVFSGGVRSGVQVSDKAKRNRMLIAFRGRNRTVNIAFVRDVYVRKAERDHFFFELLGEIELSLCGRDSIRAVITGCPDFCIAYKTFICFHG